MIRSFYSIKSVRQVAEQAAISLFINARSDIFFKTDFDNTKKMNLNEAIRRSHAYAKSGANGFFVPGLKNVSFIEQLCRLSPLPVNLMIQSGMPSVRQLIDLGVRRISFGPGPYCLALDALKEAGKQAMFFYRLRLCQVHLYCN